MKFSLRSHREDTRRERECVFRCENEGENHSLACNFDWGKKGDDVVCVRDEEDECKKKLEKEQRREEKKKRKSNNDENISDCNNIFYLR